MFENWSVFSEIMTEVWWLKFWTTMCSVIQSMVLIAFRSKKYC